MFHPVFEENCLSFSQAMFLSVTSRDGEVCSVNVPADMEVENVKVLISSEFPSVANKAFDLLVDGRKLDDGKKTLQQYGIKEGDMLYAVTVLPPTLSPQQVGGPLVSILPFVSFINTFSRGSFQSCSWMYLLCTSSIMYVSLTFHLYFTFLKS